MTVSLITPTSDRPEAIRLCERWMARQTVKFDQWIVADDGKTPARLTMGQTHIRRERRETGGASLARNILAAIPRVTGDVIVIVEDDDFYRPDHIAVCVERLKKTSATGCKMLRYYNMQLKAWRTIRNSCAALCNTAFHVKHLTDLEAAAHEALERGEYHVDRYFWRRVGDAGLHDQETVIGMKGLPGSAGIGIGHKTGPGWRPDQRGEKLREWLGKDAEAYRADH